MKLSVLDIVQEIMSDMSSDAVNSIDDTVEAGQVAQIVKSTYFAMINSRDWPHLRRTIQLVASGDTSLPTHVTLQDQIKKLVTINYNCIRDGETKKNYQPVRWVEPDDFLRVTNRRNSDNDFIDVVQDPGGIELLIQNNIAPKYFTSFNDSVVVFDSYDSEVDNTIQSSKIQAYAYVIPSWSHVDSFIPDLPSEAFTMLVEEAKSIAMLRIKEVQDIKAEQTSTRQNRWLSREAWRVKGGLKYPNYGRTPSYKEHSPYIDKDNVS